MESTVANADGRAVREVTEDGVKYLVAPMTSIVPGVLPGSDGPLYYPADEVESSAPSWDGVPLTVQHPTDQLTGSHLPASAVPSIHVGVVRASRFDGALKHEGWFDVGKLERVDSRVLAALRAHQPLELSTGLSLDKADVSGSYNGRAYTHTAKGYRPDHMAVLPDSVGACSILDGCGVLVGNAVAPTEVCEVLREAGMVTVNGERSYAVNRVSDAQRRYLWAEHPGIAHVWAANAWSDVAREAAAAARKLTTRAVNYSNRLHNGTSFTGAQHNDADSHATKGQIALTAGADRGTVAAHFHDAADSHLAAEEDHREGAAEDEENDPAMHRQAARYNREAGRAWRKVADSLDTVENDASLDKVADERSAQAFAASRECGATPDESELPHSEAKVRHLQIAESHWLAGGVGNTEAARLHRLAAQAHEDAYVTNCGCAQKADALTASKGALLASRATDNAPAKALAEGAVDSDPKDLVRVHAGISQLHAKMAAVDPFAEGGRMQEGDLEAVAAVAHRKAAESWESALTVNTWSDAARRAAAAARKEAAKGSDAKALNRANGTLKATEEADKVGTSRLHKLAAGLHTGAAVKADGNLAAEHFKAAERHLREAKKLDKAAATVNAWSDAARAASAEARKVSAGAMHATQFTPLDSRTDEHRSAEKNAELASKAPSRKLAAQHHHDAADDHLEMAEKHREEAVEDPGITGGVMHRQAAEHHERAAAVHRKLGETMDSAHNEQRGVAHQVVADARKRSNMTIQNAWSDAAREASAAARRGSMSADRRTSRAADADPKIAEHAEEHSKGALKAAYTAHRGAEGALERGTAKNIAGKHLEASEAHDKMADIHEARGHGPAATSQRRAADLHREAAAEYMPNTKSQNSARVVHRIDELIASGSILNEDRDAVLSLNDRMVWRILNAGLHSYDGSSSELEETGAKKKTTANADDDSELEDGNDMDEEEDEGVQNNVGSWLKRQPKAVRRIVENAIAVEGQEKRQLVDAITVNIADSVTRAAATVDLMKQGIHRLRYLAEACGAQQTVYNGAQGAGVANAAGASDDVLDLPRMEY